MRIPTYSETTALLTASSGGIAFATAVALAKAGVPKIMLNGRNEARCRQAVASLLQEIPGTEVDYVVADAARPQSAQALVQKTIERFGSIELLVNAVPGTAMPEPFHKTPESLFQEHVDAHFLSALRMTHAALPYFQEREGGTIIVISSDSGKVPTPGQAVTGALKAALAMFARTLALETSRWGVRVHCIMPSLTRDTYTYDRIMADPFTRKLFEKAASKARLGLPGPQDIASLIVYLAGPEAARMTGQTISVNGGISAG